MMVIQQKEARGRKQAVRKSSSVREIQLSIALQGSKKMGYCEIKTRQEINELALMFCVSAKSRLGCLAAWLREVGGFEMARLGRVQVTRFK